MLDQLIIYIELAKPTTAENVKAIPSGTYFCVHNQEIAIEKTTQIFGDYLKGVDSYLAIETAFFAGKYDINKPISELKAIAIG